MTDTRLSHNMIESKRVYSYCVQHSLNWTLTQWFVFVHFKVPLSFRHCLKWLDNTQTIYLSPTQRKVRDYHDDHLIRVRAAQHFPNKLHFWTVEIFMNKTNQWEAWLDLYETQSGQWIILSSLQLAKFLQPAITERQTKNSRLEFFTGLLAHTKTFEHWASN